MKLLISETSKNMFLEYNDETPHECLLVIVFPKSSSSHNVIWINFNGTPKGQTFVI